MNTELNRSPEGREGDLEARVKFVLGGKCKFLRDNYIC